MQLNLVHHFQRLPRPSAVANLRYREPYDSQANGTPVIQNRASIDLKNGTLDSKEELYVFVMRWTRWLRMSLIASYSNAPVPRVLMICQDVQMRRETEQMTGQIRLYTQEEQSQG